MVAAQLRWWVIVFAAMTVLTAEPMRGEDSAPVMAAVARGDHAALMRLVGKGADVNARDQQGRVPLLVAVERHDVRAARVLIEAGADLNAQADNQDSPWLLAGARGRTAILEAMLATGRVDYSKRNRFGGNALIPACHYGHVETVRLLLAKSKIDVDHVNNLGWTALLEAIILGDGGPRHTEIVGLLLAHGANVNLADREGITPLGHAQKRGFTAIARLLSGGGAK